MCISVPLPPLLYALLYSKLMGKKIALPHFSGISFFYSFIFLLTKMNKCFYTWGFFAVLGGSYKISELYNMSYVNLVFCCFCFSQGIFSITTLSFEFLILFFKCGERWFLFLVICRPEVCLETFQGGYERDFCVLKHNLVMLVISRMQSSIHFGSSFDHFGSALKHACITFLFETSMPSRIFLISYICVF